jgi:hypothetical protein
MHWLPLLFGGILPVCWPKQSEAFASSVIAEVILLFFKEKSSHLLNKRIFFSNIKYSFHL